MCLSMSLIDLAKATVGCGMLAFLIYNYPVVSQAIIIGLLTLVWLSYAYRTATRLLRRS